MTTHQRIARNRRIYNQWVANQTLEDYALRFTAKNARKWSPLRVANTAIGAISFLALEAIGGTITLNYGFANAAMAIVAAGAIIFLTGLPIAYYAARYGVDIDLLTRGAGFGYIGSTITSLIYASFTFLFFAIEAAIMSLALEMCFGIPLFAGYLISSLAVIPLVTHGITFISRFQLWTQPLWIALHLLPFAFIAARDPASFREWTAFGGAADADGHSFNLLLFGAASTVVFSLVAQIGEQVDFLRFLPERTARNRRQWWSAYLFAGPGWIGLGALKMLAGSFLAFLALRHFVPESKAAEPAQMYLVAFGYVFSSPSLALAFTGVFVIVSQLKINVTNAYAGSIAWSNFFSRLTHSHPGRVVWLVFNVAIALLLMELGIFKALEHILGLYSILAVAWVGALVADLTVNKPLKLSPAFIEFKRAHLYDINPAGVGAMVIAAGAGIAAHGGLFGAALQALASYATLIVAFVSAPAIAFATGGRFYLARAPHKPVQSETLQRCCICEFAFEGEDMAYCPAYAGPICSLCCTLDARCNDCCKPAARLADQTLGLLGAMIPAAAVARLNSRIGHYLGLMSIFGLVMGAILTLIYFQIDLEDEAQREIIRSTFSTVYFIFLIIAGVAAWLFVLAQESRRVAQEESQRQTALLMQTESNLQRAKESAEAANRAKSRYVVGISHELRTPLNAILGYAQLLERDRAIPAHRRDAIGIVRRSAEHLSGLIDGLLDIARIEAGRFQINRDEVRFAEFLDQVVGMFRLQAIARNIAFTFERPLTLPVAVYTDEKQLRQILINLLSNAIKFTDRGSVALRVRYRSQVAEFEIEDTGIGISPGDIDRIFEPFERAKPVSGRIATGTGLGLTITKLLTKVMGGDLSVESTPGKGTIFRLKLLLSEVANPRLVAPESGIKGYRGERATILIADDEPTHRDLIHETLAPLGFTLVTAVNGATCIDLAMQFKPQLVLLDISMPGMDGWEVAARLRAMTPARPAIVMLSANPEEPRTESDAPPVYDAYLMKPLILQHLLATLRTLLAIDWTEEADDVPARPPAPPPTLDHIEALLRLGEIGHIRGIQAKLNEIERDLPEHGAFVAEIRGIVRTFDLKRYMTELEAMRSDVR